MLDDPIIFLDDLPPIVQGPHCDSCPHRFKGERRVLPDGQGTSRIMLVGDSPWKDEIKAGVPFAGAAGQFLDKHIFRRLGVRRQDFILTNAMWCKPPHLNWTDQGGPEAGEALMHCEPYLDELIAKAQPKVIMALGNVALRRLLQTSGIMKHQAYVHESKYGIPVVPTFHPSFIMQDNHKYTPAMYFAFRRAQAIIKDGGFLRQPVSYSLDQTLPEVEHYMRSHHYSPDLPLAVDIETPESDKLPEDELDGSADVSQTIVRAGFSWQAGRAVTFPWNEPYISLLKAILAIQKIVVFHNKNYDLPRLEAQGVRVVGRVYDTMWMWHFLQSDLPKSLEFVAPFHTDLPCWKFLRLDEPDRYNAIDNDATLRLYYRLREWLERQGRLERFERHCVDADRILSHMGKAGILVDTQARRVLQDRLLAEVSIIDQQIQRLVPASILPEKIYKSDRVIKKMTPEEQQKWIAFNVTCSCGSARGETSSGKCRKCKGTGHLTWYKTGLRFNWRSSDQTKELVRAKGLTVPIKRGEGRESVEAKSLKTFGRRHHIFQLILDARQRDKLVTTYDWPLNAAGRACTTFGFHPSTWRKSSRSVNLQNIPKRTELAHLFRQTLIAAPGHLLVEADSQAIEAVLVGYAAGSQQYITLAKAGVHDFLMSYMMGEGIDPKLPLATLRAACAYIRLKDHDGLREKAKRVVHGTNYGLTPYGMVDEYPDEFPQQKDATRLQDLYFSICPMLKPWMRTTRERADKHTYLDNHYQYRHYFFSVFKWDSTYQRWVLGNDAKRAIAFVPSSDASAIQTEDLLALAQTWLAPYLRLIIHDSFVAEVPREMVPDACQLLYDTQTRPRPELGGLTIGSEVKFGPSLGEQEKWEPTSAQSACVPAPASLPAPPDACH